MKVINAASTTEGKRREDSDPSDVDYPAALRTSIDSIKSMEIEVIDDTESESD